MQTRGALAVSLMSPTPALMLPAEGNMPTNPYFGISENEKKLFEDLNDEAREHLRKLGWTDEQIDAEGKKAAKKRKPKSRR